jgi:hypothetical protein
MVLYRFFFAPVLLAAAVLLGRGRPIAPLRAPTAAIRPAPGAPAPAGLLPASSPGDAASPARGATPSTAPASGR